MSYTFIRSSHPKRVLSQLEDDEEYTVYNFIDERYAQFYDTVVNSSLRDAPYVIDGLLQHEVLKSDIHSTDTHGFSEMVFALTHFISVYFAPRIKGYGTQQLYNFIAHKEYQATGYQIPPDKRINWELIEENWDSILRLIVTLQLKQVSASQLLKRLSEYCSASDLQSSERVWTGNQDGIFAEVPG